MAPLTKRSSNHLLPISSMIFKSKSRPNLQGGTTLSHIEEQSDDDLTALPTPAATNNIDRQEQRKSRWRRFLASIRKLGRVRANRRPKDSTPTSLPFSISEPTDFRHVLSGTYPNIGTNEDFVKAFGVEVCGMYGVGPFAGRTSESEWTDIE